MTSINLVSPVGNGHTYSVRFREPLVIEPKSSVYLNFAKFKRNSSIYFSTDQTIQIILNRVRPTNIPSTTSVKNTTLPNNGIITIPSINPITGQTGYTPKELEETISDRLTGDPHADPRTYGLRKNADGTPSQLYLYNAVFDYATTETINVGLYKDYNAFEEPLLQPITFRTDKILADTATAGTTYQSTTTNTGNLRYDSYAVSKEHYDYAYTGSSGKAGETPNVITMKTNKTIAGQDGGIFFGLTSSEIMDAQANTGANSNWTGYATDVQNVFTYGTAVQRLPQGGGAADQRAIPALYKNVVGGSQKVADVGGADAAAFIPQSFFGIEITGGNHPTDKNTLILWRGVTTLPPHNLLALPLLPSSVMDKMVKTWSTPLASLLNEIPTTETGVSLAFQTYYSSDNITKDTKLNYNLYNMISSNVMTESNLIYSSEIARWGFFNQSAATGTATEKAQKANSQIPYNVFCSAQAAGEGWEEIKMTGFNKNLTADGGGVASNANPITLVKEYSMKCSTDIAKFLGVSQTARFNPNMPQSIAQRITKTESDQYDDDSYSIFIKNLPIKAYKNIQSKAMSAGNNVQAAGYSQPILHDIPTPYADSRTINSGSGDVIVGTFQPSIKKTLDLDNNRQVLNSLDVEIRDIETNEIAEGLAGSVINFTIEK